MSSKDLYEQSSSTYVIYQDIEAQTSQIYDVTTTSNTSPTRPLPQNIENKSQDENGKVFEFCEIIQDPCNPESVTVIKETFSEEVITETPKGSIFGKPIANKYKYCREVIQPYSKSFSTECPSYVTPREKLNTKLVVDTEQLDNHPNYEVYSNNKSIEEKINSESCESAMSSDDNCKMHCKTTFINPEASVKKCPSKTDEKKNCINISSSTKCPPIPRCPSKENQENKCSEKPKSPSCQKCDQVDESKLKCCISECIKKSVKAIKKGSATCINEVEKVLCIKHGESCEDKPTYYILEKPRCPESCDSSTNVPQQSSMQKFFDSQTQTVATIKCALKDFVGTVCNKTKEAVEVIKTESCKYLNIKSESNTNESQDKKDCSIIKTISSSINDKIKAQIDKTDISTGCESLERLVEPYVEPAKEVLDKVASIVLSTVSLTKDTHFKKIADDILDAKFNQSSELDQTGMSHRPPKPISEEHEPNSNMFTTIKTKLFSIFGQKENKDDDDDDDELSAERFFDKYCDQ